MIRLARDRPSFMTSVSFATASVQWISRATRAGVASLGRGARRVRSIPIALVAGFALSGCGGSGSDASGAPSDLSSPGTSASPAGGSPVAGTAPASCTGQCADASRALSAEEVGRVIAQGVQEAQARGSRATIAVVDRVGNVLAVYRMAGASATMTIGRNRTGGGSGSGLDGVDIVPSALGAIAKAITGAYLSTEGNAFSTRTASQIVQEHFNPGERLAPSGPLLGVQFSQLPCSDLASRAAGAAVSVGPHRSPLGLAADPGGFPLYAAGAPIGGVGVMADDRYEFDPDPSDVDSDVDERIAWAATMGFTAPVDRRAERITADGKTLRFSDVGDSDLISTPANAPAFTTLSATSGALIDVPGYGGGALRTGTAFASAASGIRADTLDYPGLDAFVLVDGSGIERFRPRAGTDGMAALSAAESLALLRSALQLANRTRAQIRRPLGTPARVSISLVDSRGVLLGLVRSRDAPLFGIDVSLQKARTAAFFSRADAADTLDALPDAVFLAGGLTVSARRAPRTYVAALRAFTGLPQAGADGQVAFTARAVGNLARPFYPDGVDGNAHGPLSQPFTRWSPFATGLQLDLVHNALIRHVAFVLGAAPDGPAQCAGIEGFDAGFAARPAPPTLANGVQIFPGSVPLYRNRTLVGAIGVSGDGVDQDDLVAFLAADRAGLSGVGNAPVDLRVDRLAPAGSRLRYVACPQSPFLDDDTPGACDGR
jgi:uncharacterized protein GlcG (DUF336 family)